MNDNDKSEVKKMKLMLFHGESQETSSLSMSTTRQRVRCFVFKIQLAKDHTVIASTELR